jgi:hypothetical protein
MLQIGILHNGIKTSQNARKKYKAKGTDNKATICVHRCENYKTAYYFKHTLGQQNNYNASEKY